MTNRKGTAAEVAVRDYARDEGDPNAERRERNGALDLGDLALTDFSVVSEVKNERAFGQKLAEYIGELEVEMANVSDEMAKRVLRAAERGKHLNYNRVTGSVIIKRPRKGNVADWYSLQTVAMRFADLREMGRLPR
jgi:hypothetical protein